MLGRSPSTISAAGWATSRAKQTHGQRDQHDDGNRSSGSPSAVQQGRGSLLVSNQSVRTIHATRVVTSSAPGILDANALLVTRLVGPACAGRGRADRGTACCSRAARAWPTSAR